MTERYRENAQPLSVFLEERRRLGELYIRVLSPQDVEEIAESWKQTLLTSFLEPDKNNIKKFQNYTNTAIKYHSRPFLCAAAIANIVGSEAMSLNRQLIEMEPIAFIMRFDTLAGLNQIPSFIGYAEIKIRGTTNDLVGEAVRKQKLTGEEADIALIDLNTMSKEAARLLIKDPTGFLLVDALVRGIKEKTDCPLTKVINTYFKGLSLIPGFFIAGAETGAELYKKLYALCPEPKIPPKPTA